MALGRRDFFCAILGGSLAVLATACGGGTSATVTPPSLSVGFFAGPSAISVSGSGENGVNNGTDNAVVPILGGASAQMLVVSQTNCTAPLTFSVSPAGASTFTPATLPCVNGSISGNVVLTNNVYGTANYTVTGSGQVFTHTQNVFGEPTIAVGATAFTPLNTFGNYGLSGAAVASFTMMVRLGQVAGAGSNLPPACNLDVAGSAGASFIIPINVPTTS